MLTSTIVFLMQLGFAMLECGMCRQNNVVATYAKNILDVVFGSMVSYFWGFHLAYGIDVRDAVRCALAPDTMVAGTRGV